jgi:hypothetical protein
MVGYADLIEGAGMIRKRQVARLLNQNRVEEVQAAWRLERVSPRLNRAAA